MAEQATLFDDQPFGLGEEQAPARVRMAGDEQVKFRPGSPVSKPLEKVLKMPIIFSLLILYQGLFSGNAISIPSRLKSMFDSQVFRFVSLMLIALSATSDIEYALASVIIFLTVIYVMKTPEERKKTGFI